MRGSLLLCADGRARLPSAASGFNNSIQFVQLSMFRTNRGICFSLKANSNLLKKMHSCTDCAGAGRAYASEQSHG